MVSLSPGFSNDIDQFPAPGAKIDQNASFPPVDAEYNTKSSGEDAMYSLPDGDFKDDTGVFSGLLISMSAKSVFFLTTNVFETLPLMLRFYSELLPVF